jgi:ABC-type transport system involved in multi-copper enzyme maturation permease subunit
MHLLPVAARELRVAARRGRTYWGRFGMGLGTILVGGWLWLVFSLGNPGVPGGTGIILFTVLATVAFLHCLAAGLYTVDAISREKREGTLGLLFLTDLRGHDVLAGKLVATGIHALLALAAIVPVLTVCLLLGGISAQVLTRTVLVLLNVLGLSLACGLFVSTLSRDARVAVSSFVLVMLLLCLGWPLLGYLELELIRKGVTEDMRPWFLLPSPIMAFASAFSNGTALWRGAPRDPYWWSMGLLQVLTWTFLAAAARWIPRVWQEKEKRGIGWWIDRGLRWLDYGSPADRRQRRTQLLDLNPVCWLSSRERWRTPAVWGVLAVAAGGWAFGYYQVGRDWLTPPVAIGMALCVHGVFKYWLTTEACRRFAEDRATGAFELMLSTAMTVRRILGGRWLALLRTFGWAWLVLAVIDLGLLTLTLRTADGMVGRQELTAVFLAGIAFLGVHFYALGWVGMWRGLTAKSLNQAVSLTVAHVLIWPWLIFWLLWMGLALTHHLSMRATGMSWVGIGYGNWSFLKVLLAWFAVMLSLNLAAALRARQLLLRDFRELATERFRPGAKPWWRGFLG